MSLEAHIDLIDNGYVLTRINPKTKIKQVKLSKKGIEALRLLQKLDKLQKDKIK